MCSSPPRQATPAPLPFVPPSTPVTIQEADGRSSNSAAKLSSARGRSKLRIDRTQPSLGSGAGLNIPD